MQVDFGYSRLRKMPAQIVPATEDSPAYVLITRDDAVLLHLILKKAGIAYVADENMVLRELDHPGLRKFTFTGPVSKVRLFTSPIVNGDKDSHRTVEGYLNESQDMLVHLTDRDYIYIYEPSGK